MDSTIIFETLLGNGGKLGLITLNRPKALNALDKEMIDTLYQQLQRWAKSDDVKAVIIHSKHPTFFCSGGDVKLVYQEKLGGNINYAKEFFYNEYQLNRYIYHYPKPYVALIDGVAMGGGLGVSLHGSHPVITEHTKFAMPECKIGFFPDIGGSYFLSRCPGEIGKFLALTGQIIEPEDIVYCGLTDYYVPRIRIENIVADLADTSFDDDDPHFTVTSIIEKYKAPMKASSEFEVLQQYIDKYFSYNSVPEIISNFSQSDLPVRYYSWHEAVAHALHNNSPLSMSVALKLIIDASSKSFDDVMDQDYKLSQHFVADHDFTEGVRAQMIDKDKRPKWQPENVGGVSEEILNQYFA